MYLRMKKVLTGILALSMTAVFMTGCQGGGTSSGSGSGTSGSTKLSGSVSTNGSTSMADVIGGLSEQFMKDNDGVKISYDPTGSGTGIDAVKNGTCDIGLSSRALKDSEIADGLKGTNVALDGIAIIVNKDSKISDLTVEQIAKIFTGEIKDWSGVGGDAGAIACIGREANSGTRDGFESITDTKDKCVLNQELTSTGAVIEAVKSNANAIGYASLSAVEGKDGITAISVEGVTCSEPTISDGTYKIQRPFVLVTKEGKALSEAAQAFFSFATSADAAAIIKNAGAVPVVK